MKRDEPSIEAVTGNKNTEGWGRLGDFLAGNTPTLPPNDKAKELHAAFARVFATEDGKRVHEAIMDLTLRQPSWDPHTPGADAVHWGFVREGQNSVAAYINENIKRGKEAK